MQQARGLHNLPAKNFSDALMSEADAEDRNFSREVTNGGATDASLLRITRAWRDAEEIELESRNFFKRDFVIFNNANCCAELSKILDEVVGERVVVVDEEKIHGLQRFRGQVITSKNQYGDQFDA